MTKLITTINMLLGVFITSLLLTGVDSQVAKGQYTMDTPNDCAYAGYLEVPDGLNVYLIGRSLSASSSVFSCTLRFRAPDKEAQLMVSFDSYTINDCDVTLTLTAKGATNPLQTFTCSTPMPGQTIATDGEAIIKLDRRNIDDRDYNYQILVRYYTPEKVFIEDNPPEVDVALIAGIVAGVVFLLIIIAIICVCCYRKRSPKDNTADTECKMNLEEQGHDSYGYSNEMLRNGNTVNEFDSPKSQKKLLNGRNDQIHNSKKTPLIDRDQTTVQGSVFKFDNTDAPVNERSVDRPNNLPNSLKKNKPGNQPPQSPTSPILNALHNNPKFRKSFQTNEDDAEKRANRISGYTSESIGSQSSVDVPESPPPPPLPSAKKVPKSPKPLRHHASIRRAYRQSSSNEDIGDLSGGEYNDKNIRVIRDKDEPPSPSEIVPIKVSDPHADAKPKHTLRPNRGKSPAAERKKKDNRKDEDETIVKERDPTPSGFQRNNSLRKKSAKSPRLGRSARGSRDQELEDFDTVSRPGTPTSIHGGFRRDEDSESYSPLRRTDSRQSLYASRSSLYGRRKRRNSFGESVSTYAHDDLDTSMYSAFTERRMSKRGYDRGFRSMGDIYDSEALEKREKETQTLIESATQTGKGQAIIAQPKKYVRNQSMRKKSASGPSGNNAKEASSKAKQNGTKAKEKEKTPKETKNAETQDTASGSEAPTTPKLKPKPKPKPKPVPRKGHSKSSGEHDESKVEPGDVGPEGAAAAPTTTVPNAIPQNMMHPAYGQPGMGVQQQPGMFMNMPYYPPGSSVPQGYYPVPQGMMPNYTQNPQMQAMQNNNIHPATLPPQSATLLPDQLARQQNMSSPLPPSGQSKSSWDLLCEITENEKRRGPSMSDATSVTGSVFSSRMPSQAYPYNGGYPPAMPMGYASNPQADYVPSINGRFTPADTSSGYFAPVPRTDRESPDDRSVSVISGSSPVYGNIRKDSWGALKELTEQPLPIAGSNSKHSVV